MVRYLIYILAVILPAGSVLSQSIQDVYRFSSSTYLGTTRFLGAGGAFVSLGNDFTGAHQNPAGLAVFRRSEFNLTMGSINSGGTLVYQGSELNDNKNQFLFSNIGFVLKFKEEQGWRGSFGLSLNKMADYNNRMTSLADNVPHSRIDMWIARANGVHPDNLLASGLPHEYLAYQSYLIDPDANNQYSTQAGGDDIDQLYTIDTRGGLSEFGIIFAAEKDNKLHLGGSLNIPFINYESNVVYKESGFTGDSISSFTLSEHNQISGVGFNIKLGALYRFDNGFRFGAAIHTPSWFSLEQNWEDEMLAELSNQNIALDVQSVYSDPYTWRLNTPWRFMFGLSKVFGKNGFLSADYELNTYNSAKVKADSISIGYLNQDIDDFMQVAHILRLGAELRVNKFYLRGGYRIETSGLAREFETDLIDMISFGAGFRGRDMAIEFAYAIRNTSMDYYFYESNYALPAGADIAQKPLSFTISYRFRVD